MIWVSELAVRNFFEFRFWSSYVFLSEVSSCLIFNLAETSKGSKSIRPYVLCYHIGSSNQKNLIDLSKLGGDSEASLWRSLHYWLYSFPIRSQFHFQVFLFSLRFPFHPELLEWFAFESLQQWLTYCLLVGSPSPHYQHLSQMNQRTHLRLNQSQISFTKFMDQWLFLWIPLSKNHLKLKNWSMGRHLIGCNLYSTNI